MRHFIVISSVLMGSVALGEAPAPARTISATVYDAKCTSPNGMSIEIAGVRAKGVTTDAIMATFLLTKSKETSRKVFFGEVRELRLVGPGDELGWAPAEVNWIDDAPTAARTKLHIQIMRDGIPIVLTGTKQTQLRNCDTVIFLTRYVEYPDVSDPFKMPRG